MRNSLILLAPRIVGRVRIGASILGLTNVEVLSETPEGSFASSIIPSPTSIGDRGCRIPIALAPVAAVAGLATQMIVMDTCGGNWVAAVDGLVEGSSTSATFSPDIAAWDLIEHFRSSSGNDVLIASGSSAIMSLSRRPGQVGWNGPHWTPTRDFSFHGARVSRAAVLLPDAPEPVVAFQGRARFFVTELEQFLQTPTEVKFSQLQPIAINKPYLTPFVAFDHLTMLPSRDCGNKGLGVGLFGQEAGILPRNLQLISLGTSAYDTIDLKTSFDVVTFAIVASGAAKNFIVGVLGKKNDSQLFFAAYQLSDCQEWRQVEVSPAIEWRTPPEAHLFKNGRLSKTDGLRLLATGGNLPGEARFFFYDGHELFQWTVSTGPGQGAAPLTAERHRLHDTRSDLSITGP